VIRAIAPVMLLGALIAAGGIYAVRDVASRNERAAVVTPEAWPICTAMTNMGTEADWALLDPDFAAGKKALVTGNWNGAIEALRLAALRDPRNADIQNYIGYAHWRLRDMGPAMSHYQRALMFNPRHRSAREHLGELYLALGEPVMAEAQLAALNEICLIPCDEAGDLARAISLDKAMGEKPKVF
jgi:Flp pilus assembly protein TadD